MTTSQASSTPIKSNGPAVRVKSIQQLNGRTVGIVWTDDQSSTFDVVELRRKCPCATCIDEWTHEQILKPEQIADNIRPVKIESVGQYAMSIQFSDGHKTGIYTFSTLRRWSHLLSFFLILLMSIPTAMAGDLIAKTQSTESVYQLPLTWQDESGKTVRLQQWQGQRVVLTFLYTNCQKVCPMTVNRLQNVQKILDANHQSVEFVLVSLDPERDSPEQFKLYRQEHHISSEHWHFLTGSEAAQDALARKIGTQIAKTDDHIMHMFNIVVLDQNGVMEKSFGWNESDAKFINDYFKSTVSNTPASSH